MSTESPAPLTDDELARLAELASGANLVLLGDPWAPDVGVNDCNSIGDFIKACSPDAMASLLAELRALRVHQARRQQGSHEGQPLAATCQTSGVGPGPNPAGAAGLYAQRDTEALGDLFFRHLDGMTREGLHLKSAIAAELAYRDADRDRRAGELADLRRMYDLAVADAARMSKRIDAEDGEVDRLAGELAAARDAARRWFAAVVTFTEGMEKLLDEVEAKSGQKCPESLRASMAKLTTPLRAALASPAPAAPATEAAGGTGEHDCRYILDGICPQCGKVFPAPAGGTGEVQRG